MTRTKVLRSVLLVGVFAIAFVVPFLFISDLYFPFITAKAYAFRVLVEIVFALWLILMLFDPTARPRRSWILWSFLGFLAITLIANLQGADPVKSFWSNFERMEGYITLLHLLAYFLVTTTVLRSTRLWDIFWKTAIAVSGIHGVYALLQKGGVLDVGFSADRIDGTFGNAIYLGVFMLLHVFITLFYLLKHQGASWVRYAYIVVLILQTIAIFLTATRGAVLALLGGVVLTFLLIAILEPGRKAMRRIAGGSVLIVIILAVMIFGFKDSAVVQNVTIFRRLSEISLDSGTVFARFVNWEIALTAAKEAPLLGYGQGNYGPLFDKYYDPRIWDQEQWFDRVHNIFLDWLVAGGLLGLLGYLSLFAALLFYIWKKETNFSRTEQSVLTAMVISYLFVNLFAFDNITSYIIFILLLAFVHARATERKTLSQTVAVPNMFAVSFSIIILIGLPFTVHAINAESYKQNRAMIEALRARTLEQLPTSLEEFEKALSYDSFGTTEVRQQLILHTSRLLRTEAPIEIKQAFANLAATEIQAEVDARPNNARSLIIAGQLLAQTGNIEVALDFFQRAFDLSPQKQFIAQPIAAVLAQQDKAEEALTIAKNAYELNTKSDDAWWNYVRIAIQTDSDELYQSLLTGAYEEGRGYRVILLAEENLNNDPENVQAWASVAVAYYRDGQTERAIQILNELAQRFPEAQVQAQTLLQQIEAGEPLI